MVGGFSVESLPTKTALGQGLTKTEELRTSVETHWQHVRNRLGGVGVTPQDTVLAAWDEVESEVQNGIIVSRDGRVFTFGAGEEASDQSERIGTWREVEGHEFGFTPSGYPNAWMKALAVAAMLFEMERDV